MKTRRLRRRILQRGGDVKQTILLCCPEFQSVVDRISKTLDSEFKFIPGQITWKTFPDRTPDIKIDPATVKKLNEGKVVYFANFTFASDIKSFNTGERTGDQATPMMDQLSLLNSLSHYGVSDLSIVMPYFPVGTMERITQEGEIPTAFALSHIINTIPNGGMKNKLYLFDIHALCSRFFFHTNTNPVMISMMGQYLKKIKASYGGITAENNFIVFPDDGAQKRFEKLLPEGVKKIVCKKVRVGEKRIIKIVEDGDYQTLVVNAAKEPKVNLFLVDDLVQSGGTILETFKGIETQLGVTTNNYPMITHAVFQNNDSYTKFFSSLREDGTGTPIITKLITTNSCPIMIKAIQTAELEKKLDVIDIADVAYDFLTNPEHEHGAITPGS